MAPPVILTLELMEVLEVSSFIVGPNQNAEDLISIPKKT